MEPPSAVGVGHFLKGELMIIGFSGLKGSGKNTAAEFVAEGFAHDYEVRMLSFAEKLKQSAAACFGIDKEDAVEFCDKLKKDGHTVELWVESREGRIKPISVTGREFLQNYGTEAHRNIFGKDFWVDALFQDLFMGEEWGTKLFLITDCRFPNEAEAIKYHGGKVVEIVRPQVETGDTHASERPLPSELIDMSILNSGDSLPIFKNIVIGAMEKWL